MYTNLCCFDISFVSLALFGPELWVLFVAVIRVRQAPMQQSRYALSYLETLALELDAHLLQLK